jgi:hypothetical protein
VVALLCHVLQQPVLLQSTIQKLLTPVLHALLLLLLLLQGLRDMCTAEGAVLCFDEVMTGFRIARGCAQVGSTTLDPTKA